MNRLQSEIIIQLKSDLCAGSGYSYAGIVDSDICYDANGIPYIPAKRLKGQLREGAELIGVEPEKMELFFGKGGNDKAKGMYLENVYPEDYETIYSELAALPKKYRAYITPQSVLEQFTTVKAQTKIGDNGAADDTSLRYTRTVNHYSPLRSEKSEKSEKSEDGPQEQRFIAKVYFEDVDKEDVKTTFGNIVKALRNIGLNRNRGLGSVKCKLGVVKEIPGGKAADLDQIDDNKEYVLKYRVKNTAPLMMSGGNEYKTERYISGRSVLGYFAGAYIRSGKEAGTEEFMNLFLKDQVTFSALYPCEEDGETIYYPAPAYINRLKKTKKYVNVSKIVPGRMKDLEKAGIAEGEQDADQYVSGNGNQPKKLNGKFVCLKDGKILVKEPKTDIVYHHTKKSDKQEASDGNLLYTAEVLREQQTFAGEIIGKGKDVKVLASLLTQGKLRFGKSKSSQYGTCELLENDPKPEIVTDEKIIYKADTRILVVLQSDALFLNENGYTVRCQEVREQIREALGIQEKTDMEETPYSEVETGEMTGYYSKWNLKRAAVPVVRVGSTFEFCLAEDVSVPKKSMFIGECTGEGFGKVAIVPNDGEDCRILEEKEPGNKEKEPDKPRELCRCILISEARERLRKEAVSADLKFKNPAALGRITLMLTDSINAYPDDPKERYSDFLARIESIKTEETKTKAKDVVGEWICKGKKIESSNLCYAGIVEEIKRLYSDENSFDEEMLNLWSDYLMAVLVQEKYNLKRRGE